MGEPGDHLTIRGGYTQVETDTMRDAAADLVRARGDVAQVDAASARARSALSGSSALNGAGAETFRWAMPAVQPADPFGGWTGSMTGDPTQAAHAAAVRAAVAQALADVSALEIEAGRTAERLDALHLDLLRAAHVYDASESAADRFRAHLIGGTIDAVSVLLVSPLAMLAHVATQHDLPDPVTMDATELGALFRGVDTVLGGSDFRVTQVHSRPDGTRLPALPAASSTENLLRELDVPNHGGTGEIAIQRIGSGPGARYVVLVPGLQKTFDPDDPRDLESCLEEVGGAKSELRTEVERAMAREVPDGAAVTVVGHSLGGIAAARLVSDPAMREKYDFTGLVTAGSPVGRIAIPEQTLALHVENPKEGVSSLDGSPNPSNARRITISAGFEDSNVWAAEQGSVPVGGDAHQLAVHADVLAEARAMGDPAVDHALGELDAMVGPGAAGAAVASGARKGEDAGAYDASTDTTTWYFTGERDR